MKLRIAISLTALMAGAVLSGTSMTATAATTATTSTAGPAGLQDFRSEVVDLTNQERAQAGCGPLYRHGALDTAAQAHAEDMANRNYFDHNSLDGRTPWDRILQAGYPPNNGMGENIAAGQSTPADVVNSWMNSPGHRANILNCSFRAIGVGYGYNGGSTYGHYWVQDFGTA